jgi:hypothetical protein
VAVLVERQQEERLGRQGLSATRAGRAANFGLGLGVGALLVGFALVRVFELAPIGGPRGRASDAFPPVSAESGPVWEGTVTVAGQPVRARLEPFHGEGVLEEHRSAALGRELGLPTGRAWRLLLWCEPGEGDEGRPRVESALVLDEQGAALGPLDPPAPGEAPDPARRLFSQPPGRLRGDLARPVFLWGREPGATARLALTADGVAFEGPLAPLSDPATQDPVTRWFAALSESGPVKVASAPSPDAEHDPEDEVARLRNELARERARRLEREAAFQELGRQLAELALGQPAEVDAQGRVTLAGSDEPPPAAETDVARERAEEIAAALRVLMRLEGVHALDLLEPGTLQGDFIGPVVFRCLDERGLLSGSLGAQRLRLEGSRAAHTLTLVLEDGFESRGGERVPFENGLRRMTLAEVDPDPWFERCPELFRAADLAHVADDGLWELDDVRRELNRLLALDAAHGWYRLHSLAGVSGAELLDVQLEELDPSGRLVRRLFADRLAIELEDGLLTLVLRDGAAVRGAEKEPFRDGRFRIVVPGASPAVWKDVALPGLAEPPGSGLVDDGK